MKWIGMVHLLILTQLIVVLAHEKEELNTQNDNENPKVQVRAVFLNCVPDDLSSNRGVRFEREELFKHNALKDCNKKLALTVKISSESGNSGDEYLPIEHVFEGPSKKRIRLLDPYILRLRREPPLQAYTLRKLETVSGVLMHSADQVLDEKVNEESRDRVQRETGYSLSDVVDDNKPKTEIRNLQTYSLQELHQLQPAPLNATEYVVHELKNCEKNHSSHTINDTFKNRYKRKERNIIIETFTDDDNTKLITDELLYQNPERQKKKQNMEFNGEIVENNSHKSANPMFNKETSRDILKKIDLAIVKKRNFQRNTTGDDVKAYDVQIENHNSTTEIMIDSPERISSRHNKIKQKKSEKGAIISSPGKDYLVYEIGSPELWYSAHVQLFEKLSTPDGKAVWNDLTKGKTASVSSTAPEWIGEDLAVRYRSTKWIPRDDFFLPSVQLRLLVPDEEHADTYVNDNEIKFKSYKYSDFLVLPEEDIVTMNEHVTKPNDNNSDSENISYSSEVIVQKRRVLVRTSRAILNGNRDSLTIASNGTEKFLTLKHQRPHHAQIDLEARADGNELVRIGSSGRISIAVADSTRPRTVLHFQVGNTGLAAARFRIEARDFDPLLSDLFRSKKTTAGPIFIPPRHTRSLRLELPVEIPIDMAHCSVALVNDGDQSVAVRNVKIKKGDRCFCVWYCDCVCLGNDPNLMCRDMDEVHQKAAGLCYRDRSRQVRSVCYPDDATLNMFVIFIGVLITLLLCGLVKAVLGLVCRCVGTWGLHQLLQTPRKLDHYYERCLRGRSVKYDAEGWPIHPDTYKRNVHLVSVPMQFFLNTIFFISVPCLVLYEIIKQTITRCPSKTSDSRCVSPSANMYSKKCFSSQDIQERVLPRLRRRREDLRRWMSPQAQDLSTQLWTKSLNVHTAFKKDFMQPLLRDNRVHDSNVTQDSCQDSEQDDTDYVLTQMQKSRESLAVPQTSLDSTQPHLRRIGIQSRKNTPPLTLTRNISSVKLRKQLSKSREAKKELSTLIPQP